MKEKSRSPPKLSNGRFPLILACCLLYTSGIRPGKPTQEYLEKILSYLIFIGAAGLVIVAVIPFFFNGVFGANVSFGGTSLIIVVGVVLETLKQIESRMLVRNYKGFLSE